MNGCSAAAYYVILKKYSCRFPGTVPKLFNCNGSLGITQLSRRTAVFLLAIDNVIVLYNHNTYGWPHIDATAATATALIVASAAAAWPLKRPGSSSSLQQQQRPKPLLLLKAECTGEYIQPLANAAAWPFLKGQAVAVASSSSKGRSRSLCCCC